MTAAAALAAALLLGASPFVAEQPRVREGNERLLSGDAPGALERYQAAEGQAGPRPEIDFDRGNALHAQGKHAEAREAWKRALERDPAGPLASRALQNAGNALDAAGDREGAAKAFADALARDPANEDARYNLEVLLRRKATGKGQPKDPGDDGARKQQQGPPEEKPGAQPKQAPPKGEPGEAPKPQPQPGTKPNEPKPDQQRPGQDQKRSEGDEERREQGKPGQAGERRPGEEGREAGARPDGLGKQDAERLLDALRARERQMPLDPTARKKPRRTDGGRDW